MSNSVERVNHKLWSYKLIASGWKVHWWSLSGWTWPLEQGSNIQCAHFLNSLICELNRKLYQPDVTHWLPFDNMGWVQIDSPMCGCRQMSRLWEAQIKSISCKHTWLKVTDMSHPYFILQTVSFTVSSLCVFLSSCVLLFLSSSLYFSIALRSPWKQGLVQSAKT